MQRNVSDLVIEPHAPNPTEAPPIKRAPRRKKAQKVPDSTSEPKAKKEKSKKEKGDHVLNPFPEHFNKQGTRLALCIDTGLSEGGFALLEMSPKDLKVYRRGMFSTNTCFPEAQRIHFISNLFKEIILQYKDTGILEIDIEESFFNRNRPGAVLPLNRVIGALCFLAAEENIPMVLYRPQFAKKTLTTNLNGKKEMVEAVIKGMIPEFWDLPERITDIRQKEPKRLKTEDLIKPPSEHEVDAAGIGVSLWLTEVKIPSKLTN